CGSIKNSESSLEATKKPTGVHVSECNSDYPLSLIKLDANSSPKIAVTVLERPSTGYRWISKDGFSDRVVSIGRGIGSNTIVAFDIDMTKQRNAVETYKFDYRRSWEKPGTEIAKCEVTIKK
ncbi:MAG: hypothetical protein NTV34_00220, partial [Proteobacteria bacterium]|nr:hypothetical protein [Pseudomonadota bacterium]